MCATKGGNPGPPHVRGQTALRKRPLLDLDMRLGETSGAALAVPLLKAAAACPDGMATIAETGVGGEES